MNKSLLFCAVACLAGVPVIYAQPQAESAKATVLSVYEHQSAGPAIGDNPSDAPLRSEVYSYDILVRVKCAVLSGRYESASEYLPSAFAANQNIPVTIKKHDMIFEVPGYGELKMPIVKRKQDRSESCNNAPASSGDSGSLKNNGVSASKGNN